MATTDPAPAGYPQPKLPEVSSAGKLSEVTSPAGTAAPLTGKSDAVASATALAQGTASSALTKKIQKALSIRIDSQATRESLKCLSGILEENTAQSRRNLRAAIDGHNLQLHKEFVQSFEGLERQLASLDSYVTSLDSACDQATNELRRCKAETQVILEKAAALRSESSAIEQKQEVLEKFLDRFQLSEADTHALRSGDHAIDEEFFKAFEKLERVRSNARQMMSSCGQQTSGVDILHETSEVLEAAYERLFVWVQQQCRSIRTEAVTKSNSTELDTPAGAVLRRALSLLVERPVYFNHCMRDVAKARKQALVQRFVDALRQGDVSGSRPIELQATDPVRYVGDMLAWIHENAAFEKEAVSALMGPAAKKSAAGESSAPLASMSSSIADTEGSLALSSFNEILDQILEGLVQPFSTRVKQVLEVQTSIVVVYKVGQILLFFAKTLRDVLGHDNALIVVMCKDLYDKTQQSFLSMWEHQHQKLRQGVSGVYVSDLSVPAFVQDAVNTLTEVLTIYDSALVPAEEREADFLPVLSAAYDPLLNHCQQVGASMDAADGQVFLVNCVAAMQTPLRKHDFTSQRVAMFAAVLDEQIQKLVDGQAAAVLSKLGLAELLRALRQKPEGQSVSQVPEFQAGALTATLRSFYNSLFTLGGALALPMLERIVNRSLRSEARSGVTRAIASSYEELYNGISELGIATHTPEQVKTLLE
mmetsp:Transcript_67376/g.161581  ORF Transcript_67376/g.161581 Transcript_67376/m.161581 type:complete len:707 (-) Transcript_67376:30-2150(-)